MMARRALRVLAVLVVCVAGGPAWAQLDYGDVEVMNITTGAQPGGIAAAGVYYVDSVLTFECDYAFQKTVPAKEEVTWPEIRFYFKAGSTPLMFHSEKGCFTAKGNPFCKATAQLETGGAPGKVLPGVGKLTVGCEAVAVGGGPLKDAKPWNDKKETSITIIPRPKTLAGPGSVAAVPPAKPGSSGAVGVPSPKGLADLTGADQLKVGGVPAKWGSAIPVDAKQAFAAKGGTCQFVMEYTVRNAGLAPTGAFGTVWTNSHAPGSWSRSWGSLEPGKTASQTNVVDLKPGQNILRLALDNLAQVQESNESNNDLRIIVKLNGPCGAGPGVVQSPGVGSPGSAGSRQPSPGPPRP